MLECFLVCEDYHRAADLICTTLLVFWFSPKEFKYLSIRDKMYLQTEVKGDDMILKIISVALIELLNQ